MNSNMRKMYTEEQIRKLGGIHFYSHDVTIVDKTDADNPVTKLVKIISFSETPIKVLGNLYSQDAWFILSGFVDNVHQKYLGVKQPNNTANYIYYLDTNDGEIKSVTLGKMNKLTISDVVTEFKN